MTTGARGNHRSPDRILPEIIVAAAGGGFPPADGSAIQVPPWRDGVEAIVSFTGFAVLAVDGPLPDRPVDGFGAAHDPRLIAALAGPDGWIDSLDAFTGRPGRRRARGAGRPARSRRASPRHLRRGRPRRRASTGPSGRRDVAVLGRGIAGLTELSMEVEPGPHGAGRALVRDTLASVPADEVVVAAVAPGNAASLRALLAAGFTPIGSVQLFRRA